jgi:hypothetical protein
MDKQNDIDVSKCKHYHRYYVIDDCKLEHYCDDSYLACGECDECYYRQLQWKIHECEAHQKAIKTLQEYINAEWKRNCKKEDELIKIIDTHIDELQKYKTTLNEIKDICKNQTETRMLFADKKSFADFCEIEQMISEVKYET